MILNEFTKRCIYGAIYCAAMILISYNRYIFSAAMILGSLILWYELYMISPSQQLNQFLPYIMLYVYFCLYCWTQLSQQEYIDSIYMVWIADSSAYIIGQLIKGPSPFKWLSPNKTYSGYIGSVLCVILYGKVYGICGDSVPDMVAFAIIAALGDLFGSLLKRIKNINNSSNLIPGHGGLWDRWDSFLPIGPFIVWLL